MKNRLTLLGCLTAMTFIFSCSYEDMSTKADHLITDIVIDTVGMGPVFQVSYGDTLALRPRVSRLGNEADNFSYEWRLSLSPNATTNIAAYKVVGKEKYLSYKVDVDPDARVYKLWYRVTDNLTGLLKSVIWDVEVLATSGQGLVVADTDDGMTSDLSVIQNYVFTLGMNEEQPTIYRRNLLAQKYGVRFDGVIRGINYQQCYLMKKMGNYLFGYTKNQLIQMNTLDYSYVFRGSELLYDQSVELNVENAITLSNNHFDYSYAQVMVTNGKMYRKNSTSAYSSAPQFPKYGLPFTGGYVANGKISMRAATFMFYDEQNGQFNYLSNSAGEITTPTIPAFTPGNQFDPGKVPGYQVLAAGGAASDHVFILKKEHLYQMYLLKNNGTANTIKDISAAPDIDKAIAWVICDNQTVVYYATPDHIYAIKYPLSSAMTFDHVYSSEDEITGLSLLRKTSKKILYDKTALVMTTYGVEGKVWILPIANLGIPDFDESKIRFFDGFKRITAVTMTE